PRVGTEPSVVKWMVAPAARAPSVRLTPPVNPPPGGSNATSLSASGRAGGAGTWLGMPTPGGALGVAGPAGPSTGAPVPAAPAPPPAGPPPAGPLPPPAPLVPPDP